MSANIKIAHIALCMLLHHLLLFLFPLLPDRAVIYTAQPNASFPLLYETVFIPWDIWTENQRPRVRTRDIPSVPPLCMAVCALRDL